MSLNRETIGLGEQALLTITVLGGKQDIPTPDLPDLSAFNVYSQGTSTNITIVNGKMETSYSYQYLLQPKKAGKFTIGAAHLDYNRARYTSNTLTLTVIDEGGKTPGSLKEEAAASGGENKDIFLTAEVDKKNAFVNEQITLKIKFYHAVQLRSQPEYTAPQTTDFWTDMLEPQRNYYTTINGRRYRVIEITSALFPTRSGELTIGPAMVTAAVPTPSKARKNDPFGMFDDFFQRAESQTVRSRPITIKVSPLPVENRPADFSGTVGNYSIQVLPDKTVVDVNQPVTVTYKISGTGNIKTVAEPKIGDLMDFRVYRASSDEKISKINGIVGGTKIFEEVYIPKRAGRLTIPAVKLDYFDPGSKKYKTVTADPITLEVHPSVGGEYADVPLNQVAGMVVDPKAKDIRYIKMEPGELGRRRGLVILTPLYLVLNGAPVILLGIIWINRKRQERLASDVGYARSRQAKKLARKRLATARKLAAETTGDKFFSEIRGALFSYVADRLNISPHGITGDNLLDILRNAGFNEELLGKTATLLKTADFAQYASSAISREEMTKALNDAEELLIKLEEANLG
jgi:hypothetical protein